jgi:peptidoglycan/LPS O-acetylase OafA/YrhL
LVGLGRVSYGVYLYHFPIFQLVHNEISSQLVGIGVEYAATAAIVTTSWFLLERPCLRLKGRIGRPRHEPISSEMVGLTGQ